MVIRPIFGVRCLTRRRALHSSVGRMNRSSVTTPIHLARLELRHRAVHLQRRRFWREVWYGLVMVLADLVTMAAAFSLLARLPLHGVSGWMGPQGEQFLRFLLPDEPLLLGRRLASLLFCLIATRSYSYTERQFHSGRIVAALLLGLALPRWTEIWTAFVLPRSVALVVVLLTVWALLLLQRRALTQVLRGVDPRALEPSRTLIVGPEDALEGVEKDWHARAARSDRTGGAVPAFLRLSATWPNGTAESLQELYEALAENEADAIVLVGPVSDAALQSLLIAGSSSGCRVFATRRRAFQKLDEPSFLLRRAEPLALLSRPALVGSQLVLKRVVDLLGAMLGLVVALPILLLIGAAIRLTSRGPALFRQTRVGLGGDPFVLYKFRTMVADAEAQQAGLAGGNEYADSPLFKMRQDPRLTSLGKFLRRSSLDELPQLLNVLRGEMSLVGPRPALPSEVERYQPHHFVRFEVLPGITGPWQVGGRNAISDFEEVVRMESAYIRGWTLWRDLRILVKTIPAVLSMKGAY